MRKMVRFGCLMRRCDAAATARCDEMRCDEMRTEHYRESCVPSIIRSLP
eukprot:CAMPEP_0206441634 /NCGR_PEP_ID=MMETSP0324_2-20121206/13386_1 /ASSEMBLY_ACC=CAM_ASM_000836 /TAXON_ID=2866 /ORGANISM="Crypthecodinium cohnii, Strain Seligo" /LENGTH=48 /DNA_ID= /DNA_START= /DNA_END= /DNA_ORIENTATION=